MFPTQTSSFSNQVFIFVIASAAICFILSCFEIFRKYRMQEDFYWLFKWLLAWKTTYLEDEFLQWVEANIK